MQMIELLLSPNKFEGQLPQSIIAIDPGPTCGVAMTLLSKFSGNKYAGPIRTSSLEWPLKSRALKHLLYGRDHIIVEDYRPRHTPALVGDELIASQCLGYIKGVVYEEGWQRKLTIQQPSVWEHWKDFVTDKLHIKPETKHELSALAHLVGWLHSEEVLNV